MMEEEEHDNGEPSGPQGAAETKEVPPLVPAGDAVSPKEDAFLMQQCKRLFTPLFCFGCLLVFLFLRVQSVRWFWGMVVRSFARRDLC